MFFCNGILTESVYIKFLDIIELIPRYSEFKIDRKQEKNKIHNLINEIGAKTLLICLVEYINNFPLPPKSSHYEFLPYASYEKMIKREHNKRVSKRFVYSLAKAHSSKHILKEIIQKFEGSLSFNVRIFCYGFYRGCYIIQVPINDFLLKYYRFYNPVLKSLYINNSLPVYFLSCVCQNTISKDIGKKSLKQLEMIQDSDMFESLNHFVQDKNNKKLRCYKIFHDKFKKKFIQLMSIIYIYNPNLWLPVEMTSMIFDIMIS